MKNKIVGIVGGMGPESTSNFYLDLTRMSQRQCSSRPSVIIDSLPIRFSTEEKFIKDGTGKGEFLRWLTEAIKRLEKIEVNFIVIPCNTVHIFIDKLRKITEIPIISITEETARICSNKRFKKVGILATKLTIENQLYDKEFEKFGIKIIKISKKDQKELDNIIHKIVIGQTSEKDQKKLEGLIQELKNKGSEAIVLGCTDLQILLKKDLRIEIIDSMHALAEATFERLLFYEK